MAKFFTFTFVGFLLSLYVSAQNLESIQLYYPVDSFKLNNAQKYILDSVVENYSNRRILIDGHADYNANENSNLLTSTKRATTVLRYLVDRGFPETQVIHATGAGESITNANGRTIQEENPKNRRVDIFITKGPPVKAKLKAVALPDEPPIPKSQNQKNITDINYKDLKVGDIIALKNISFVPGTDNLKTEAFDEFNNLYEIMAVHPTLKIRLEGHVCCSKYPDGYLDDTPSWILSENRALKVRTLLIEKGIDSERLSSIGFGHTKPIFEEEDLPSKAQANRRVEIRIIAK